MTERRGQRRSQRRRNGGIDWLKAILVVAVLMAIFAGTEVIARQDAALPASAPGVATQVIIPGNGSSSDERLQLPPVPTAVSRQRIRPVARTRSSR